VCVRLCACVHACMLDLEGSAANEHLVMGLFRFLCAYINSVCACGEDSLCVCVCVCVQDLEGPAANEHLVLDMFKIFERMPCRVDVVQSSGLWAAVKKLRGNVGGVGVVVCVHFCVCVVCVSACVK